MWRGITNIILEHTFAALAATATPHRSAAAPNRSAVIAWWYAHYRPRLPAAFTDPVAER
jgi:hypothetical protein